MESMSQAPHLANIRGGINLGNMTFTDSFVLDGLTDAFSKRTYGPDSERVADKYNLSRERTR
jgi:acetyl-CoA C-acetyltransferase